MNDAALFVMKMKALRQALGGVHLFYAAHVKEWREQARTIAIVIFQNARPADADADEWHRRVATESERITGTLFMQEDEVGAVLALALRPPSALPDDPAHYSLDGITVSEIERFVAAGRAGEPGGKAIDYIDENRTDLQIAWRIIWAIKTRKGNFPGLIAAIQQFLGGHEGEATALYGDILKSWLEQLGPRIRGDFREWVGMTVRGALK